MHALCKIVYGLARTVQIQKCLSAVLALFHCARLALRDFWCYGVLSDSSSLKLDMGAGPLCSPRVKAVLCLQAQVNTAGRKCGTSAYQKLRERAMLAVL